MTNREIREWYNTEIARLPELQREWEQQGDSLERRARLSWQFRHNLRLRARELMEHQADVVVLRERDRAKYGDPNGPSFEYLLRKARENGISDQDAFLLILDSAGVASQDFNRLFGIG